MNLKEEIIKDLSIKYNLSEKRIELMVNTLFKFILNKMADDENKTIMIHYFGKFAVKKYRAHFWKEINEDKNKISTRLTKDQNRILRDIPGYKDRSIKYWEFIQFNKEQKIKRFREKNQSIQSPDNM